MSASVHRNQQFVVLKRLTVNLGQKMAYFLRNFGLIAMSLLPVSIAHADVHVRSLAGSCAACHGTNGNSVAGMAQLAGIERAYFVTQMMAFKTGARPATVMHRHAAGLTESEIQALADFFSTQAVKPAIRLKSEPLK